MPKVDGNRGSAPGELVSEKVERLRQSEERLAINLDDLGRMDPEVRQRMVTWRLDLEAPARATDDEVVLVFKCPLIEAAKACDLVRSHDREVGDPETRVYRSQGGGPWNLLPPKAVLCSTAGGKCVLSPNVFRTAKPVHVPLPFERVDL
jgi:hypothetical protein